MNDSAGDEPFMKSVVQTIPSIAEVSSGPSYSVVRLCDGLTARDCSLTLAALDSPGHRATPPYTKLFPRAFGPARLGRSPAMHRWLESEARAGKIGLLHNHSLWMMPNVYPGRVAAKHRIPYVVAPRGTFAEAAFVRGSMVKRFFWPILQRPALHAVTLFHATAESERDDIRRVGYKQPIAILPNGVDLAPLVRVPSEQPTLLFLGRVHPSKGVDLLLRAWAELESQRPTWRLRIVGPDNEGHLAKMRTLAAELRVQRVQFDGPLTGKAKLEAYSAASLYILPSHSENFGLTVAEALSAGTPAIVTQGAPWSGLRAHRCGWWIERSVASIRDTLLEATALPSAALADMGLRGRAWMEQDFAWDSIADRMLATYEWIHSGLPSARTPAWVDCV
ncbi:MAG: glycosyltransferase [Limnohabitans sp.]|nr:glycosyltransferase [Limnohabitans sp.]